MLGQQGQVLPGLLTEETRKSEISERIHAAVMIIGSAILLFGPCELIGVAALCSKGVRNHFKRNWRILMGETVQSVRQVVIPIPVPQPVIVPFQVSVPVLVPVPTWVPVPLAIQQTRAVPPQERRLPRAQATLQSISLRSSAPRMTEAPTSESEESEDDDSRSSSAPRGYRGPRLGRDLHQEMEGLQMEIEGLKAYNDELWKTAQTVPDLRDTIAKSDLQVQQLKKSRDIILGERDDDREKLKKALLEMSQLKDMNGKLDQSLTTQKMEHEKELTYLVRDQASKIKKAVKTQTDRVKDVEREMTSLAQRVVVAEETATQYSALPIAINQLKETNRELSNQLRARDAQLQESQNELRDQLQSHRAQLQESQEKALALEGELTTAKDFLQTLMQHKAIGETVRELVQAEAGSDE